MTKIGSGPFELRNYLDDKQPTIASNEIAGSHLLGVSKKAGQMFESIFDATIKEVLRKSDTDYEKDLRPKLERRKPYEKLTLGERVQCFKMLTNELATLGVPSTRAAELVERLSKISRLRSDIEHNPSEELLRERTLRLMQLLREVISERVFSDGLVQNPHFRAEQARESYSYQRPGNTASIRYRTALKL